MRPLLSLTLATLFLLLSPSSPFTTTAAFSPSIPAQRVIRGWGLDDISANRWSGAVVVKDRSFWADTAVRSSPPIVPSNLSTLTPFNLSSSPPFDLAQAVAASAGRAWVRTGAEVQRLHHYLYVDLDASTVLLNVSHTSFAGYDYNAQVRMAVDASDRVYVVSSPGVWVVGVDGRLVGNFTMQGAVPDAQLCVDVDSAGTLWVLGQLDYADRTYRLSHYTSEGKLLSSITLNVTEQQGSPQVVTMAVSDAGMAYIAAGVTDYIINVDGTTGVRGANLTSPLLRSVQGQHPAISLLNATTLLVASAVGPLSSGTIEALDTRSDTAVFTIANSGPNGYGVAWLQASAGRLLLLERSPQDSDTVGNGGLQAIHPSNGSVAVSFPLAPRDPFWENLSFAGLAVDNSTGSVWVSALLQDNGYQHEQAQLQRFSPSGDFIASINASITGELSIDGARGVVWIAAGFNARYMLNALQGVRLDTGEVVAAYNVRAVFPYDLFFFDVQAFVNASGHTLLLLLADAEDKKDGNGALAVVDLDIHLQGTVVSLPLTYVRSLHVDAATGYVYVAGYQSDSEQAPDAAVLVLDASLQLLHRLVPPQGWEKAEFMDVTVDEHGVVFVQDWIYPTIFVWDTASSALPSSSSSSSSVPLALASSSGSSSPATVTSSSSPSISASTSSSSFLPSSASASSSNPPSLSSSAPVPVSVSSSSFPFSSHSSAEPSTGLTAPSRSSQTSSTAEPNPSPSSSSSSSSLSSTAVAALLLFGALLLLALLTATNYAVRRWQHSQLSTQLREHDHRYARMEA